MKLKDYSLQIKKNIAVLLHIIFLTLAVAGISVIYLHSQIGSGISWLLDRNYDDSDQFQEQFQKDLDSIFQYVTYRDIFETDGSLDLSRKMFTVSRNDSELTYTLEEVLRYAKSQGFYLDDNFQVVNDFFIYDNASTAKDQKIVWRAYPTKQQITEPGDAYTSLLELSKEVLQCLSSYYTVYHRMIANPSNLYFKIMYEDNDQTRYVYTNAESMTLEQLKNLGRYCYLNNDSIFIETNLQNIPQNITVSMEKNNFSDAEDYYIMAVVDTHYPANDEYAEAAQAYDQLRGRFLEALAALAVGIVGCLVTLYYLILVSGYRDEKRTITYLHGFDMITPESCVALTVILTLFALFLGEKVGYKLIHLLVGAADWDFAERMMRAVIIYTCCMASAFSLLRRYKSRQLWENSLVHNLKNNINIYFANRSFTHRLACLYSAFLGIQLLGISALWISLRFWSYTAAKVCFLLALMFLIAADYIAFHKLFISSAQEDRIADAIARIAGGDTAYQMNIDGLSGKELDIAYKINRIGTGLEHALQEKVKSERLKADLITNVSHDIKTPLTSIINYVDLIKREHVPNEKVQEYLDILDQKSQRLKTLTEDLVEASKASSGNLKLEMNRIDLVEMIWQTSGEFEEKFATRQLELVTSLPTESVMIEADGRHLWRVLENLYNNAFKYAMAHSRVYTDITCENGTAYFTIKNVSESPLNINSDELTERFVRGDVSRSTEGSGLGLSIAQSLTKLQGGTFEILIDGDLFKVRVGFALIPQKQPES